MLDVLVSGWLSKYYIFNIYQSPSADDSILDFLLAKLAAVQHSDIKTSYVLIGDLNAHNEVWGSPSTSSSGRAALDFA